MGSVMDYVACPQCGGTMFTDYYYKSCEEYWVCKRCGKHGKVELVRDDNGHVIYDEKGKVQYTEEDVDGYGCAKFAIKNHGRRYPVLRHQLPKRTKRRSWRRWKMKR